MNPIRLNRCRATVSKTELSVGEGLFGPTGRVDRALEPPHDDALFALGAPVTGLTNRQNEILNIARAFGRVMVEDLARRFEVSAQTIRKDLNDLCDHRSLTRIHGGAIIASGVENLAYEAASLPPRRRKRLVPLRRN